jgi:hypothetical protein
MANDPAAAKAPGAEPVHCDGVKARPRPRAPMLDPVFMHDLEKPWLGL